MWQNSTPTKLDLKKELKWLYSPSAKQMTIVEVPPLNYLMIDGRGDPNTAQAYKDAVEALYSVAYTLKFTIRKARGIDFTVMPLEGLWWADNMDDYLTGRREDWYWTMMIMQPELVTAEDVTQAVDAARKKNPLTALPNLRLETYVEGTAAQILYFGAYRDEGPTIARLHDFIVANGGELSGKHHEIYVGDPRRTAPEKLKTIIRQPLHRR